MPPLARHVGADLHRRESVVALSDGCLERITGKPVHVAAGTFLTSGEYADGFPQTNARFGTESQLFAVVVHPVYADTLGYGVEKYIA